MKIKQLLPLLLTLASFAVFAAASPLSITFVGGSGTPLTGTVSPSSTPSTTLYYPYTINVNGSDVTVACDDYFDDVSGGQSWQGIASSYDGTNASLSQTLFYNGGAGVGLYKEAFWLYSNFQATPPDNSSVNEALNFAIWDLFDANAPTVNVGVGDNTDSSWWLDQAQAEANNGFTGFNFANYVVYTPTSWSDVDGDGSTNALDDRPQEFIGEVPEPATLALFGGGLLLLGLLFKRRLASAEEDLGANV